MARGFVLRCEHWWLPALERFGPEMIFVSAGFDAHREDDMASLSLVEADYAWVTREIKAVAERHAQGRIVSSLEGGYALQCARTQRSVASAISRTSSGSSRLPGPTGSAVEGCTVRADGKSPQAGRAAHVILLMSAHVEGRPAAPLPPAVLVQQNVVSAAGGRRVHDLETRYRPAEWIESTGDAGSAAPSRCRAAGSPRAAWPADVRATSVNASKSLDLPGRNRSAVTITLDSERRR